MDEEDIGINEEIEREEEATPVKKKCNIRVRPPLNILRNTASNRSTKEMAANKAAVDLVKVTQETNTIKENYYNKKLQIMEESLEIQKKRLKILERIAVGVELLLRK